MPELPEVHTTANDLNKLIKGKKIVDIWNYYKSSHYKGKKQIKDPVYFQKFKKEVLNKKIISVRRRAKNVLIDVEGPKTILIHMKMTGHLLYGKYELARREKGEGRREDKWKPVINGGPLNDKMNGWIRLVFELSNGKHLVLSDMRKFAKVTLEDDTKHLGPEPLEKDFSYKTFVERINKKPTGKIKTVIMNQELIAGVGNIYSDEALWLSKIHPERLVKTLREKELKDLYKNIKFVLQKGIKFNGDSMSDYRRPNGNPGEFQLHHNVYQRKGLKCKNKKCKGIIERTVVNGRSSHFCPTCQTYILSS